MTRSSKSRRSRIRAKKRAAKATLGTLSKSRTAPVDAPITLNATDKRYILAFAIISLLITIGYFWLGGRNLFVFPALFVISVGVRRYWSGPLRQFADSP